MLMEVKNQLKVSLYSVKYALQREMLNKITFISNIIFMIINNGCFIIQWLILYSLKNNIGGYSFKQVLLLWGIAASTYGFAHFFFSDAFNLSETINTGKLDNYLTLPKNVLISCITSSVEVSAIGDMIYGIIMLCLYGLSIKNMMLFLICSICGAMILTSVSIIFSSLSFWFNKSEIVTETANNLMVNFATYPEGIFKPIVKIFFYTIIPLGISTYVPVKLISNFSLQYLLLIFLGTAFFILLAFIIFYKGLKKYGSTNLMNVRV